MAAKTPAESYGKARGLHRRGTRISQPSADSVLIGTLYYVTDEPGAVERSNGTSWDTWSLTNAQIIRADRDAVFDAGGSSTSVTSKSTTGPAGLFAWTTSAAHSASFAAQSQNGESLSFAKMNGSSVISVGASDPELQVTAPKLRVQGGDLQADDDVLAGDDVVATDALFERGRSTAVGAWTTYTPTWGITNFGGGGEVQPTVVNGTIVGRKCYVGRTVFFNVLLTWGSSTTNGTGTAYTFTLPESGVSAALHVSITFINNGVQVFNGWGVWFGGTALGISVLNPTTGVQTWAGPTFPFTPATADTLLAIGWYEF